MNTLSNGAIAVGAPGSIMRLLEAYEFELRKEYENGNLLCYESSIQGIAKEMLRLAYTENAVIEPSLTKASTAVGIENPTKTAIRDYLINSGFKGEW